MRDAAGKLADGLHLLRLAQLLAFFFSDFSFGDIARDDGGANDIFKLSNIGDTVSEMGSLRPSLCIRSVSECCIL